VVIQIENIIPSKEEKKKKEKEKILLWRFIRLSFSMK
jgi:hypothetical protein